MKSVTKLVSLAFAAFAASSSFAIVIRHDVADALYIAEGNKFDGVGRVLGSSAGGTGTMISSRWVLTAAHVVVGNSNLEMRVGGGVYSVLNSFIHPLYAPSDAGSGADMALLELSSDVTNVDTYDLYYDRDENGKVATTVGFGLTGNGNTGAQGGTFGTRRAGTNVIELAWDAREQVILSDFDSGLAGDNLAGSATPLDLEMCVASGDSGGALFIEKNGVMRLAGVTKLVGAVDGAANSDYGDVSGYSRISDQASLDWIESTSGVPEPATMTLLGLGAIAAWRKKRAKK